MSSGGVLHADDLRRPVLTPAQRLALERAEQHPAVLEVDAVLDRARARTGLSDFGSMDFLERMQVWLDEVRLEPKRTALAGHVVHNLCTKYAANRLRIEALLARHPEIEEQRIEAPVFVTGLPRSGTTHLVNLLAADDRFRSLPLWEADQPVPDPGDGPGPDGRDPRFGRAARAWEQMQQANPFLAAWHTMAPDSIHEDIELWSCDFAGYSLEWILQMAPRWRDHYTVRDQTPHYRYLEKVLKILQWYRPGERWLLKCPQHLENLGALTTVFPDATIVMTQRDPVGVVQSAATMRAYGARSFYTSFDVEEILEYWTQLVTRLLERGMNQRPLLGERVRDVYFDAFMADTRGTVEQVYRHAGIDLTDRARARIEAYVGDNPRAKHGTIGYDLAGDFGVTPAQLRGRFDFYLDEFPVEPEVS